MREAQQELANHKNGCFQSWVEHLGISYQTGYDLITIYQNAGTDIIKLFDNKKLNQTVAVMLLRSPELVIDKAVAKAESGEKVTVADVKNWKAELETERQARAAAERIKLRLKRTVEDIIEIGRELTTVKAELPHGQFLPWIAAEFEMSEDTAARKRAAFEFQTPNKKPLARAKGYDLMQSDALPSAPAAEPITPATGAIGNEICN